MKVVTCLKPEAARVLSVSDVTSRYFALLLLAIGLVFASGCVAQDASPRPERLSILALNTEWLWSPRDGAIDGEKVKVKEPSQAAYQEELEYYVRLITNLDVDLVSLAEIEGEPVLQDMVAMLGQGWRAYFRQGRDTATGQDVGIIARVNSGTPRVTDFGFPGAKLPGSARSKRLSKVLGVGFEFSGEGVSSLQVVTAHFLSRRNESKRKREDRYRQAYALSSAVAGSRTPHSSHVVMGDFNDTLDSRTLDILLQKGKLKSVFNYCLVTDKASRSEAKHAIDHILYSGLNCVESRIIRLERKYTDHPAIFAKFVF